MTNIITLITAGTCPSGWTEDTTFLNRIPAFDSTVANVMTTGGVASEAHSHSTGSSSVFSNSSGNPSVATVNTNAATITLLPLHIKVRFCKRSWTGEFHVPSQSLHMFDNNCPSGFSKVTVYDNRQPVGATASLGTTGQTAGAHTHSLGGASGFGGGFAGATASSIGSSNITLSTNLFSYVKVVLCRKS